MVDTAPAEQSTKTINPFEIPLSRQTENAPSNLQRDAQPQFKPSQNIPIEVRTKAEDEFYTKFFDITQPDLKERTATTMQTSIDQATDLGLSNPYFLAKTIRNAETNARTAVSIGDPELEMKSRRHAIVGLSVIGNMALNAVDIAPSIDQYQEKDLDLGGSGMKVLQRAAWHVRRSQLLVEDLNGKSVDSKVVTPQEKEELQLTAKSIEQQMARIDGKHDLDATKEALKGYLRPSVYLPLLSPSGRAERRANYYAEREGQAVKDFYISPRYTMDSIDRDLKDRNIKLEDAPAETKRLLAKLFRDDAIARIALAEVKIDGGDVTSARAIARGDAKQFAGQPYRTSIAESIEKARGLAPNNLDLPALQRMSDHLSERLTLNGKRHNPFGLPKN